MYIYAGISYSEDDNFIITFNGVKWETRENEIYDPMSGGFITEVDYVSYEVIENETFTIGIKAKQGFDLVLPITKEIATGEPNYNPITGGLESPTKTEEFEGDVNFVSLDITMYSYTDSNMFDDVEIQTMNSPIPETINVKFRSLDNRVDVLNEYGEVIDTDNYNILKNEDYTFKLSPDENLSIELPYSIDLGYNPLTGSNEFVPLQDDYSFTINSSRNLIANFSGLSLTVDPQPSVENYPFIKIYDTDIDSLEELSKMRYDKLEQPYEEVGIGNVIVTNEEENDLAKYIMSLIRFPFKVDSGESTNILLGKELTDVKANTIDDHLYTLKYGNIHISQEVWGGVSFSNVEVELYVPHFDKINLDVDEVLDNTLKIEVVVNLLTGKATLNIYNGETGMQIYSKNEQVGQKIPYILGETVQTESGSDILENDVINPYVEIKKHIPRNTKTTAELSALKIEEGVYHMQVDEPILSGEIPLNIENNIVKLLKGGVYIRGHENMEDLNVTENVGSENGESDFWDKWGDHGGLIGG